MPPLFRHPSTAVLAVLAAVLLVTAALSYENIRRLDASRDRVENSQNLSDALDRLVSKLKDAETNQRDFLITENERFIRSFNNARSEVRADLAALDKLARANPAQRARLEALKPLVGEQLAALERTIELRRVQGLAAAQAVIAADGGGAEGLRAQVREIESEEQSLLDRGQLAAAKSYQVSVISLLASTVLGVGLIGLSAGALAREARLRRAAAVALAEEKESFRTTLASIGDAVIATDTEGRVTMMNPVAERLTAWLAAEALGQALDQVFKIVNETTRSGQTNPVARVLSSGQVQGLANHTILIARDSVERSIDDSAAPIRDRTGAIRGVVLIFRDISARRAAQRAQELSEQRARLALDTAKLGTWSRDIATNVFECSAQHRANFGRGPDEPFGYETVLRATDPQDNAWVRKAVDLALASRQAFEVEYRIRWPDGTRHWLLSRGHALYAEDGSASKLVGVSLDITNRKAVEESLSDADRKKDEFLAMLAHELRNPLAPITSALDVMRRVDKVDRQIAWARDLIHSQVRLMMRLVDDLLDVSRLTRGKVALQRRPVVLSTLVDQAVESVRPAIDNRLQRLTVELPAEPVYVYGDPVRLVQVLTNLLTNATKYTLEAGSINVEAHREASDVILRVRDTGIGIAPEMLPHVFDIFAQADNSASRKEGGLGIGLTIVRNLVHLHGGSVQASSAGIGQGSEFSIRLPVAAEPVHTTQPSDVAEDAPDAVSRPRSYRILIIDDNPAVLEAIAILLEMGGHNVRRALDGPTGLALAREFQPQLVLCDIGLPGMDGYAIIRALREQAGEAMPMVAALTGYGQAEDIRRTRAAGFALHLVKPIEADQLDALVESVPFYERRTAVEARPAH